MPPWLQCPKGPQSPGSLPAPLAAAVPHPSHLGQWHGFWPQAQLPKHTLLVLQACSHAFSKLLGLVVQMRGLTLLPAALAPSSPHQSAILPESSESLENIALIPAQVAHLGEWSFSGIPGSL